MKSEFSKTLKRIRKERGLNIQQLSFQCRIARETLSRMEKGDCANPTLKTLKSISEALGVTVEDLVREEKGAVKGKQKAA